jgi:hypothetical protein
MKKKEKIPATVRNAVWCKYIGELNYSKCFCCNYEPITKGNYECGHVISEKNGGNVHLDNLRPICSLCNKSMGTRNMEHFMKQYGFEKNKKWYGSVVAAEFSAISPSKGETSDINKKNQKGSSNDTEKNENVCDIDKKIQRVPNEDTQKKYIKHTLNKPNNIAFINKMDNTKLIIFLDNLSLKQLQQLCLMLEIRHCGTKNKLKQRIIIKKYSYNAIIKKIHNNNDQKYFIECRRFEPCSNHDEDHSCDNCKTFYHTYFTDNTLLNKLSNKKKIVAFIKTRTIFDVDNIECEICNNISSMEEHDNEFYEKYLVIEDLHSLFDFIKDEYI